MQQRNVETAGFGIPVFSMPPCSEMPHERIVAQVPCVAALPIAVFVFPRTHSEVLCDLPYGIPRNQREPRELHTFLAPGGWIGVTNLLWCFDNISTTPPLSLVSPPCLSSLCCSQ
jgi:hypothetical protein